MGRLTSARSANARTTTAVRWLLAVLSVGACRQTVFLDGVPDAATAEPPSDGGAGTDAHPVCESGPGPGLTVDFTPEAPDVIIALDRSTAMNAPFGSTTTQLGAALNSLGAVISKFQNLVRFGYVDFPDSSASCVNQCCASDLVPPTGVPSPNPLGPGINCNDPAAPPTCTTSSQRPMAAALTKCNDFYSSEDPQVQGRAVLLITDGPPSCGSDSSCPDRTVQSLRAGTPSVVTAVVTLGNVDDDGGCLSNIAVEGGDSSGNDPTQPEFFNVTTPSGLTSMLNSIVSGFAQNACHLQLASPPIDTTKISLGDPFLVQPGPSTWSFDIGSSTRITLNGNLCTMWLNGAVAIKLYDGCVHAATGPSGH